jgi:hypothetical protein
VETVAFSNLRMAEKHGRKLLGDELYTGVTDMVYDPRNPNRVYAVTWEHHRTVAAWMGGGEKSRLYVSDDAGDSWRQLETGSPKRKMGQNRPGDFASKPGCIVCSH